MILYLFLNVKNNAKLRYPWKDNKNVETEDVSDVQNFSYDLPTDDNDDDADNSSDNLIIIILAFSLFCMFRRWKI